MPGERRLGMDHELYAWYPLSTRPPLKWPEDARIALTIIVSLDRYEWRLPVDSYKSPELPGGIGGSGLPFPDVSTYTLREYGQRVGLFRLMDILAKYGVRPNVAVNGLIAEENPGLLRLCRDANAELIAHGVAVNQMITSRMDEDVERAYINRSTHSLIAATGSPPRGWLGPEYGESTRTTALLAENGNSVRM